MSSSFPFFLLLPSPFLCLSFLSLLFFPSLLFLQEIEREGFPSSLTHTLSSIKPLSSRADFQKSEHFGSTATWNGSTDFSVTEASYWQFHTASSPPVHRTERIRWRAELEHLLIGTKGGKTREKKVSVIPHPLCDPLPVPSSSLSLSPSRCMCSLHLFPACGGCEILPTRAQRPPFRPTAFSFCIFLFSCRGRKKNTLRLLPNTHAPHCSFCFLCLSGAHLFFWRWWGHKYHPPALFVTQEKREVAVMKSTVFTPFSLRCCFPFGRASFSDNHAVGPPHHHHHPVPLFSSFLKRLFFLLALGTPFLLFHVVCRVSPKEMMKSTAFAS